MKLLDTMVIVSALNPTNRHHKNALSHLRSLQSDQAVFAPTSTLTEFDLVLRNSGYTESEVEDTWRALVPLVGRKVLGTTPTAHMIAAKLRVGGLSYFDSLIAALAKETESVVVTRDVEISKRVQTEW